MSQAVITSLQITGITCGGCVTALTRLLKALPGVEDVEIDQGSGNTQIRHASDQAGLAQFRQTIQDAGYDLD
ncbi:MAG: heavy-metal-associated domain-containing protein [Pigmentiphaga sp.]|nr:heavy-metal-associated domain-containing protein [Pigmentiphaga sp.]